VGGINGDIFGFSRCLKSREKRDVKLRKLRVVETFAFLSVEDRGPCAAVSWAPAFAGEEKWRGR